MSLPQEIQDLSYNFSLVLSQWHIFIHSLSDELEQLTFLSIIVGVSHFPFLGKKFPQCHLIFIKECPKTTLPTY